MAESTEEQQLPPPAPAGQGLAAAVGQELVGPPSHKDLPFPLVGLLNMVRPRGLPACTSLGAKPRRNGNPRILQGNTCFMNSVIQSILCVEELLLYFRVGAHTRDINGANVLGMQGRLATAWARLLDVILRRAELPAACPVVADRARRAGAIAPRELKALMVSSSGHGHALGYAAATSLPATARADTARGVFGMRTSHNFGPVQAACCCVLCAGDLPEAV